MKPYPKTGLPLVVGIACVLIFAMVISAGCTSGTPQAESTKTAITMVPVTPAATPVSTMSAVSTPAPVTETPAVTTTPEPAAEVPTGLVVAYTAASLKGASARLGPAFEEAYPGTRVIFDLDGTQILKHQVESGAYADVFISASNTYTNALKAEGYFITGTVKPLTSNYIIVILPAANSGHISSLADLGVAGKRIAMGTQDVPVGMNTRIVIKNLANSSFTIGWSDQLYRNVKTYETTEPGIVTKVSLGEVDAGFVYESSYKAAPKGTLSAIDIPKENNALQTYSVGVMGISTNKPAARAFEDFLLSAGGQKILTDFGFRPVI
jgi:molybdate transport system substrate-binding protein